MKRTKQGEKWSQSKMWQLEKLHVTALKKPQPKFSSFFCSGSSFIFLFMLTPQTKNLNIHATIDEDLDYFSSNAFA